MRAAIMALLVAFACSTPAAAHSSARGFVLLLPTSYVIVGGAVAVLATFVAISLLPGSAFQSSHSSQDFKPQSSSRGMKFYSLMCALVLVALIAIGFAGPRDPLENFLSLSIWTVWWVVIVLLHPILGNIWAMLNPFSGLYALVKSEPIVTFPQRLYYVPAFVIFVAFAWFQLVYPAPEDPQRLAIAVSVYATMTMMAVFLFGAEVWLVKGDPFAVFLSQLGAVAPLDTGERLGLRLPGAGLVSLPALPLMGTLFVLLTLSAISFDGFANTFFWLSAIGINPLDYPGRTALVTFNTLGLAGSFIALAVLYMLAIAVGWKWAGSPDSFTGIMGRFVFSLVPISVAYHFAHYLSDTLVNLQYLAVAMNDPLGRGADLLGLSDYHVTASFQNTASGTLMIFSAQTSAVVLGHIVSVVVAHAIALQKKLPLEATWKLEAPLVIFMVAYTAFGLWLLSTPSIT